MAQVSEEPEVFDIYEDLFKAEGSEIYLKPLSLYLADWDGRPLPFADLFKAAQVRGEICFGVRRVGGDEGVFIIPPKDRLFELGLADQLIVLAEDES